MLKLTITAQSQDPKYPGVDIQSLLYDLIDELFSTMPAVDLPDNVTFDSQYGHLTAKIEYIDDHPGQLTLIV